MRGLVSYAQNFEDVLLWRALGDIGPGVYVDVGAASPDVDSVSRLFFEQGWRGVHIEPVPVFAQALRERRPGDVVVQAVVGSEPGLRELHVFAGTGLSTLDAGVAQAHVEAGRADALISVPCVTLDHVLDKAGPVVHWLKIDVEGAEADVLAGWRGDVRPWVVVVEATRPMSREPAHEAWEPMLLALGYRFALFDGLNRFYVAVAHLDRMSRLGHGACVFDGFALDPDSSASFGAYFRESKQALEEAVAREQEACAELRGMLQASRADADQLGSDLADARRDLGEVRSALVDAQARVQAHAAALEQASAEHREERTRLGDERELLLARCDEREQHARWLGAELAVQRDRTIGALEDARRWQAMAQARGIELTSVYASTSWRVTAPLRGVRIGLRSGRSALLRAGLALRAGLRAAVIRLLRLLGRSDRIRRAGATLLGPFPALDRRARWAVSGGPGQVAPPGLPAAPALLQDAMPQPVHESDPTLSPYANALLRAIQAGRNP